MIPEVVLSNAQPRQYAKNIIQATLAFGKIHYGIDPLALLDYLVDAKPLESPPAKAPGGGEFYLPTSGEFCLPFPASI